MLHDLPVSWLCVAGYGHYLLFPNLIDYDIGGWLSPASVYLLSYVAISANQRPVLMAGDQWGGVFAVLWLLLCPMVIMWPDTTISDDRRARVSRLGSTGVQVDTGPHSIVNTESAVRGWSRVTSPGRPGPGNLPPAGKCSLDNTQTWPGPSHLSHWHPQWHTRAVRQNTSAVPWYPTLPKKLTFLPPRR